jgi:N-methylhydantoinase A
MRVATDTGGTFTDLVVEDDDGQISTYKSLTTPSDPISGLLNVLAIAASDRGISTRQLLQATHVFIHGTTRSINAVLTGDTAKTAFLVTRGHPDILTFREGGRLDAFDFSQSYPAPYVPRSLTFEVPERIGQQGDVVLPIDEIEVVATLERVRAARAEAVAVCLLWSIVNPAHELRVGELIEECLPGLPYTLSHRLNPTVREYRRASSACIDASLKPVMAAYLNELESRLRECGLDGDVLMITSTGGVLPVEDVADAPIHSINSGPSVGPVAGRYYGKVVAGSDTAIVADTGGTSYDVSLVRRARIPFTRETWLGQPFLGHMTGFPSVDVKSIGAGGGSIAWVDDGGMLRLGPRSAGADPGPACYSRGGREPTVTDAAVVLGHIDPAYFLGGGMPLDREAAVAVVRNGIGEPFGLDEFEAAAAIVRLATEHMVRAIEEITLHQGVDPRSAVLVGGGGAAGLNVVAIGRRLGSPQIVIPGAGAVLSAVGALLSELTTEYAANCFTTDEGFDIERVNVALSDLTEKCERFIQRHGRAASTSHIELSVEAMYRHQIWELEVPLRVTQFRTAEEIVQLRRDFDATHDEVFAIQDISSAVEFLTWRARVRCSLRNTAVEIGSVVRSDHEHALNTHRKAYFEGAGLVDTRVMRTDELVPGVVVMGPVIVESPLTTIVLDPGAIARSTRDGSLLITPVGSEHVAGGSSDS